MIKYLPLKLALGLTAVATLSQNASASAVRIEIENLGTSSDFFLTPLWAGLHNGSFDLFSVGTTASAGLEELAETGSSATLQAEFAAPGRLQGVAGNPAGFGGGPVIDPGETAFVDISIINPVNYQYFSFASMIIPSNDSFIGNGNPLAYQLFDASGNFNGPLTIDITAANIYDSGTELNDGLGAAFSANGGAATDTTDFVTQGPDLTNFIGTGTAAGTTIGAVPGSTPFAQIRVTVVPEPSATLFGALAAGLFLRRRRS